MFHIVLFEPRIPQNTGNIARTCAVTGCQLHLIKPYAFKINDRNLKRAGLTYWSILNLREYENFEEFYRLNYKKRIFILTKKTNRVYSSASFQDEDMFLFGREDTGLPGFVHEKFQDMALRIPMVEHPDARCVNLSTSVGIVLYEGLRQINFCGLT